MSRVEHIRELAAFSGCPVSMCASAIAYAGVMKDALRWAF